MKSFITHTQPPVPPVCDRSRHGGAVRGNARDIIADVRQARRRYCLEMIPERRSYLSETWQLSVEANGFSVVEFVQVGKTIIATIGTKPSTIPPINRLRRTLKALLRRAGMRCVSVTSIDEIGGSDVSEFRIERTETHDPASTRPLGRPDERRGRIAVVRTTDQGVGRGPSRPPGVDRVGHGLNPCVIDAVMKMAKSKLVSHNK